jgi:hypothetical protein
MSIQYATDNTPNDLQQSSSTRVQCYCTGQYTGIQKTLFNPFPGTACDRTPKQFWQPVSPLFVEMYIMLLTVAYRGGVWGVQPPPPKFRNFEKVPKIKKILLYEIKFLVPNYSCLQNPWLGGHCPQIPVLSVLNWISWIPPRIKFLGTPLFTNSFCKKRNVLKIAKTQPHLFMIFSCYKYIVYCMWSIAK